MKEIKNYPNYKVGKDGKIVSYKYGKIKELKPQLTTQSGKKYLSVGLYNSDNRRNKKGMKVPKMHYVHKLVWEAYMGEIPKGLEIDHIDENPHNCSLDNLRLLTHRENASSYHRNKNGFIFSEKRDEIIKDYLELKNYQLVADKWGCCLSTVFRVVKNRRWVNNTEIPDNENIKDKFTKNDLRSKEFRDAHGFKSAYEWRKDI